ncbi:MAG: DUF2235 domain-containing protein [Azonexus sp.]|uniref:phospholipase effector Tle1 domain-containing protein n=1 Tax=Azonexus sp. TaxID=1872668 RepID=UPI00281ED6A1|nr:DUF2235 domain-containing protein [Azonexus sp.]MDR0775371.1 DUF2235 domain-containing protein [Azonexus sp.]
MRDVDNAPPSAAQDCSDVIHIAVFFDGTGNNKEADHETKKWSNVARIWQSAWQFARANEKANAYAIYVSGVGTLFNGKALFPGEEKAIDREDGTLGGATGAGGTRRLDYGQQQINDALRMTLLNNAKKLDGTVASYAKAGKQQSFSEVNRALGQHRLIKQINVSIFGFSRGAALARAFCNQWLWDCKEDRGKLTYEGYPIRFCFLGLFDTVASFGLPATNTANNPLFGGFQGRDLVVDERVERCVHQVAAHELRFAFPVDLIRKDGQLAGNWLETVYPGVHSDIGGGYEPTEQEIDNNYARIPMRDMMKEGLGAGTRLFSYQDIERINYPLFQERFECRPETEAAYKAYRAACNPGGSVEACVKKHMEQLYSAFGTLHRQGGESVTQREHRKGQSWSRLAPDDMAKELENYAKAVRDMQQATQQGSVNPVTNVARSAYIIRKGAYAMWIAPQEWQLNAWRQTASEGVMSFIHGYVHDSKVGFMSNAEPFSYFSQRGIGESSRSVYGWFESNIVRPVDKAVEDTVDYATEKAQQAKDYATEKATEVKDYATEKAQQVKDYATEKAQQAKEAISDAASQGKQIVESAGDSIGAATQKAVDGLNSAWEYITK